MTTILDPTQMTEEDVKLQYMTPVILKKWDKSLITMETQITDGRINIKGNKPFRAKSTPSLAEQKCIFAKTVELLQLCDK